MNPFPRYCWSIIFLQHCHVSKRLNSISLFDNIFNIQVRPFQYSCDTWKGFTLHKLKCDEILNIVNIFNVRYWIPIENWYFFIFFLVKSKYINEYSSIFKVLCTRHNDTRFPDILDNKCRFFTFKEDIFRITFANELLQRFKLFLVT